MYKYRYKYRYRYRGKWTRSPTHAVARSAVADNFLFDHKLSTGISKIGISVKIALELQEPVSWQSKAKNPLIEESATSKHRRGNYNVFYERVNRITSRDYNPIFDTDFASLVRYDRFPSLLYGSCKKRAKKNDNNNRIDFPGYPFFLLSICFSLSKYFQDFKHNTNR